jgi:dTDP-4-dehydrorhamnose reductase
MPRILLTGKTGQVGHYLLQSLAPLGEVIAPDRKAFDLQQADSIRTAIRQARPDIIVNAAGLTLVDEIERDPEPAMLANGVAPGIIAGEARRCNALLVHYSTVFVFDGTKEGPYAEEDAPAPVNAYGRSKLAGENAIAAAGGDYLILRASWTYSDRRSNFPLALLKLAREKKELTVVDDQTGTPTWARAYADTTAELLKEPSRVREHRGIYHLSSAGQTTRYGWAREIIRLAQEHARQKSGWAALRPIAYSEYPHVAPRPLNTVMDSGKFYAAFGMWMLPWEDQLRAFLREWAAHQSVSAG